MKEVITIDLNCTPPECPTVLQIIGEESLHVYSKPTNAVLISFYVPLFFTSLFCNILMIAVVCQYDCLKSITNYLLVNLCVSDLLVTLFCMPMSVGLATFEFWPFGNVMCKLMNYLQGVAISSGVFTITVMSIDRYMAVRHPFGRRFTSRRQAAKLLVLIWFLALSIFGPILFIRKTRGFRFAWDEDQQEYLYCVESWPNHKSQQVFGIMGFFAIYVIPGLIVGVAYTLVGQRLFSPQLIPDYKLATENSEGKDSVSISSISQKSGLQGSFVGKKVLTERQRVAKILIILAIVFALCWLPYSVLLLLMDLCSYSGQLTGNAVYGNMNEQFVNFVTSLMPFALLLGHAHSTLNPVLFGLLSKKFRRSVKDFLHCSKRPARQFM